MAKRDSGLPGGHAKPPDPEFSIMWNFRNLLDSKSYLKAQEITWGKDFPGRRRDWEVRQFIRSPGFSLL